VKEKKTILAINNTEEINMAELTAELFAPADQAEKESVVQMHESVGFWKDAYRRFTKNKISMFSLFLFILILIFAYIGPLVVPYSYETQKRDAQLLGPMQWSPSEQVAVNALEHYDKIFSTDMITGSTQYLMKETDYYFEEDGVTYNLRFEKAFADQIIIYDKESKTMSVANLKKDLQADGSFANLQPLAYTEGEPAEGAIELEMMSRVFPHVFGTDTVGRDVMSRTMYGTRISLLIGFAAAFIVLVIGSTIGALCGLLGGKVDMFIMRYIDILSSIPNLMLVILVQMVIKDPMQNWLDTSDGPLASFVNAIGYSVVSLLLVYALLYWTGMARTVRGLVLRLRKEEFITAEKVLGANNKRVILKHLIPNCMGQLILSTVGQIPGAIFTESSLSYLGIGIVPPNTSLGALCSESVASMASFPMRLLVPSVVLSLIVLSLNLVGDGLRDAMDPRLK